jgi:mono/diheme cytochrome c family protein
MLWRLDKTLAVVSWITAALLALMLIIGPQVVAEDEAKPTQEEAAGAAPYGGGETGADGEAVFTERCGSCHTLTAAGTSGQVGPDLDGTSLDASEIEAIVRDGEGSMPAFGGQLSDAEITAVASYVADSSSP